MIFIKEATSKKDIKTFDLKTPEELWSVLQILSKD